MLKQSRRALLAVAAVLGVLLVAVSCGSSEVKLEATRASAQSCDRPTTATSDGWVEPIATDVEPVLPTTTVDFSGEEVTVTDASRILALDTYGTLATTVHALGLGDRLVGRDISTGVPELADLPVVTHNGHNLNAEAILELDPSFVLTDYSIGPLEVQLQLKDAGIPVVILDSTRNRAVIGEQIRSVAEVLGVPDEGERLVAQVETDIAEAQAEVDALREAAVSGEGARRMAFLYMRGSAGVFYWFGEGSGADDLIEALGGVDVASETGLRGSKPLNAEGLIKADPDVFLMMTDGLASVGGPEGLLEVPGVAETVAGSQGCVIDMADAEILSFGPQFPSTLRALGQAIYGVGGALDEAGGGQ